MRQCLCLIQVLKRDRNTIWTAHTYEWTNLLRIERQCACEYIQVSTGFDWPILLNYSCCGWNQYFIRCLTVPTIKSMYSVLACDSECKVVHWDIYCYRKVKKYIQRHREKKLNQTKFFKLLFQFNEEENNHINWSTTRFLGIFFSSRIFSAIALTICRIASCKKRRKERKWEHIANEKIKAQPFFLSVD